MILFAGLHVFPTASSGDINPALKSASIVICFAGQASRAKSCRNFCDTFSTFCNYKKLHNGNNDKDYNTNNHVTRR